MIIDTPNRRRTVRPSGGESPLFDRRMGGDVFEQIARLKELKTPASLPLKRDRRKAALLMVTLFLVTLLGLFQLISDDPSMRAYQPVVASPPIQSPVEVAKLLIQPRLRYIDYSDRLPPLTPAQVDHLRKVVRYIDNNVNPDTYLGYSLPGDRRLTHWSVVYDDAMRAIMHIYTGDTELAKNTLDYFIENKAIRKTGWIIEDGRRVQREGWIVNIVDAAEARPGGRGIEHIAHVGPNIYLGIAAVHLFNATGEKKYLYFSRQRWSLAQDLQNEERGDPNYGGIRMGPMGDPNNPQEQRLEFDVDKPSWYQFYNGEHAADFKAFSDLLYIADPVNAGRYFHASNLVSIWDRKIFDKKMKLFAIGTTEVPYYDSNVGRWMDVGVIPVFPLDTTALKLSVYGVDGLEQFEPNGAEIIRQALEDNFRVTVQKPEANGGEITLSGYDFVGRVDRPKLILYKEEGPGEDIKVIKGRGRKPMLSDEWSTWVALADLRLAQDYLRKGQNRKARHYLDLYHDNALVHGFAGTYPVGDVMLAYPYSHPLPTALNEPVGFGWNTHHEPFSVIGGVARTLGALRVDPFQENGGNFSIKLNFGRYHLAKRANSGDEFGLITEAEMYLQQAWVYVKKAREGEVGSEKNWYLAAMTAEKMINEHPDWGQVAEQQNRLAERSVEKYPLYGEDGVTVEDLQPVFRRYWALYHVGTAEFIKFMSYSEIAKLAKLRGDETERVEAKQKVIEAVTNIIYKYSYSQVYDERGWMWQPVKSVSEYLGFYRYTTEEYLDQLSKTKSQNQNIILEPLLKSIDQVL